MAFVALLDANVLWSAAVRDTAMRAAEAGLFRAVWTRQILDEMGRSLKRKRPDLDPARIDSLAETIVGAFPDALVVGYEDLIPTMRNHEGDRHVLAAAVRAGASVIVTSNLAHFPAAAREPFEIELQSPDEFLCHLFHLEPETIVRLLHEQSAVLTNPPQTVRQVLATLRRSVPEFVATVQRSGLLT